MPADLQERDSDSELMPGQRAWIREACRAALADHADEPLASSMCRAVEGGKCLRSLLVAAVAESLAGSRAISREPAVAVELVHAASLVVDDLPALDDGTSRRGRPSLHLTVGSAEAILCAHALVAAAFRVLSGSSVEASVVVRMTRELSETIGGRGMALGEVLQLRRGSPADEGVLRLKSGGLFRAAAVLGALVAETGPEQTELLGRLGLEIGCLYQMMDDWRDGAGPPIEPPVREDERTERSARCERLLGELESRTGELAPLRSWLAYFRTAYAQRAQPQ